MYNEWELLAISEDIEPGDTVTAENDEGEEELLVYVKQKSANIVVFKDAKGRVRNFSTQSLEEVGEPVILRGKSAKSLRS